MELSLFQDGNDDVFGGAGTEPTPSTSGVRTGGAVRQPASLDVLPSSGPAKEGRAGMSIVDSMLHNASSDVGGISDLGGESDFIGVGNNDDDVSEDDDNGEEGGSGSHSSPGHISPSSDSSSSSVENHAESDPSEGAAGSANESENEGNIEFLNHLR